MKILVRNDLKSKLTTFATEIGYYTYTQRWPIF